MAFRVSLNSDSPGHGILTVEGAALPPDAVQIAIQRNLDEHYLGPEQDWRTTPYWHPVERLEATDEPLRLEIGPDIVDGIVAASSMALRIWVRSGELADYSVLRIKGQLLGSHAASVEPTQLFVAVPAFEPERPVDEFAAEREAELRKLEEAEARRREEEEARQRDQERRERKAAEQRRREAERRAAEQRARRRWQILAVVLLLLALLAAGIMAWQLGWLHGLWDEAPTEPEQTQPQTQTLEQLPPARTTPGLGSPPSQPSASRGRQGAQAFLSRDPKPTPREMFTAAQEREQSRDCEGAMILYTVAADADAALALALAQRYDPDTFRTGPCLAASDADTASYWYEAPARAGDPVAQRQLGKMLTSQYASGAVYEQGVEWLRRAAEAGDQEAKTLLSPEEVRGK